MDVYQVSGSFRRAYLVNMAFAALLSQYHQRVPAMKTHTTARAEYLQPNKYAGIETGMSAISTNVKRIPKY
jgi:hypothetical protein